MTNSTQRKQGRDLATAANTDAERTRSFTGDKLDWMTAMMADHRLDARAKVVAFCIAQHINQRTHRAILSDPTIADKTGIAKRWVQRARSALRALGWIDWKRTGDANVYWALSDPMDSVLQRQRSLKDARDSKRSQSKIDHHDSPRVANIHLSKNTFGRTPEKGQAAIRLPVDFSLNHELTDIAAKERFEIDYTKRMFEKFRLHHQAMGSVRADWTSAWRYWVHRQVDLDTKAKELERSTYIDGRL